MNFIGDVLTHPGKYWLLWSSVGAVILLYGGMITTGVVARHRYRLKYGDHDWDRVWSHARKRKDQEQ